MLNRGAVIVRWREPAIRWINDVDPSISDDEEDPSPPEYFVTAADTNDDPAAYLVPQTWSGGRAEIAVWLEANFDEVFARELHAWCLDKSLWPAKRDYGLFCEWFDVEICSEISDVANIPMADDEGGLKSGQQE